MNPWLFPYLWFYKGPLSGDVDVKDISPLTNLLSPQIEVNLAGDRAIEAKVVTEIASYGKQLGILTEALLALAGESHAPEIERLREINDQITDMKAQVRHDLVGSAKASLDRLQAADPAALERLVRRYLSGAQSGSEK